MVAYQSIEAAADFSPLLSTTSSFLRSFNGLAPWQQSIAVVELERLPVDIANCIFAEMVREPNPERLLDLAAFLRSYDEAILLSRGLCQFGIRKLPSSLALIVVRFPAIH